MLNSQKIDSRPDASATSQSGLAATIADLASDVILVYTEDGVILRGNHAASEWLGYARETFPFLTTGQLGLGEFPKDGSLFEAKLRHAGGRIISAVGRSVRADGTPDTAFVISLKPAEDSASAAEREAVALRERAEKVGLDLRRKEAEFFELTHFFVAMLENTDDFMFFKDANHVYKAASSTMARITGHKHWRELIGKTDYDIFPKDHSDNYMRLERELKAGNLSVIRETQPFFDECGREGWVDNRKYPVRDVDGHFVGLFGVCRIITDQIRLEKELREALDKADTANQAKSRFLATMSHELRTPLNAVLGFSDVLLRDAVAGREQLSAGQRETLETVRRAGEHLLALINNVLEFSRIEAGHVTAQLAACDLHELIDGVCNLFVLKASNKGLSLRAERAADLPRRVSTDEIKLRQVLINLLSNAVKYTERGEVTLHAGVDGAAGGEPPATWLRIEVADTGHGIAVDELGQLCTPFAQTASSRGVTESTGLGLAISRQFVELLGGTIVVDSSVGQGSRFVVRLPVELVAADRTAEGADTRPVLGLAPGQPAYRLLVVDDDADNRRLLVSMLAPLGFELREAVDGEQAVACWHEWRPRLIWMDIRMPVMDGREATRRIKAAPDGQETVIVALTASSFVEERDEILAAGCDDFMRKPFREHELFERLERHLGVRFMRGAAAAAVSPEPGCVPEALAGALDALPDELRKRLADAAVRGHVDLVEQAIAAVRVVDAALAEQLDRLAADFDFSTIVTAAKKESTT